MIKAMLIDDDVPVVEYLRKLVPWEELGLRLCTEAYSAAEAIERFDEALPDVLVTDIGLPDGNGIELARRFRDARPRLRVIFLTCHEDFHYVKEALRIEADDYIVKDEMNPEKIADSLRKAASRIHDDREQLERIAYKSDLERNRDILLQEFFRELSHAANSEGLLEQGRRLGLAWHGPQFAAALLHLDLGDIAKVYGRKNPELIRYAAYNIASELAAAEGAAMFLAKDRLLWAITDGVEAKDAIAVLERTLPRIREKLQEYLKIDSYAAISQEASALEGLGGLIGRLKTELDARYYDNSRLAEEPGAVWPGDPMPEAEEEARLEALAARWIESVRDGSPSAPIYLVSLERAMKFAAREPGKAKEGLLRIVQELSVRLGRSVPAEVQEDIARSVRLGESFRVVRGYADRLAQAARDSATDASGADPELKEIDDFIREHMHRNVSSIDVARHLHLNPSYFSRFFKKRTGTIFTDYVHLIKMEEAKRLLVQGETAENTAYLLGYSDRAYFSKVFKKYTGMSPSECKLRQQEERNQ